MMDAMESVVGNEVTKYTKVKFSRTVLINALPAKKESKKEWNIPLLKTEKQRNWQGNKWDPEKFLREVVIAIESIHFFK